MDWTMASNNVQSGKLGLELSRGCFPFLLFPREKTRLTKGVEVVKGADFIWTSPWMLVFIFSIPVKGGEILYRGVRTLEGSAISMQTYIRS